MSSVGRGCGAGFGAGMGCLLFAGVLVCAVVGFYLVSGVYSNARCLVCGEEFSIPERHRGTIAESTREYRCPNCGLRFPAMILYKTYQEAPSESGREDTPPDFLSTETPVPRSDEVDHPTVELLKLQPETRPQPEPDYRLWTDSKGKFTVEAEFAGCAFGKVKLRKPNGTAIEVPLEKLSEADQVWIRKRR